MHGSVSFSLGVHWEERTPTNAEGRPSGGLREVLDTRSQWAAG
ncbi:hypothetical protein STVIR_6432 [Streptomyces viridochromogenes Tue57]|uniref:Uncharacterized protein n=1 Tax=Streptomyces viridochromogenes Tue57 TaxID=1160705 RepID=L8P4Z8_STRVR|nr:hypothetical protein STVIR_6432 [Streptomyces viridochromogenes Tue57]